MMSVIVTYHEEHDTPSPVQPVFVCVVVHKKETHDV